MRCACAALSCCCNCDWMALAAVVAIVAVEAVCGRRTVEAAGVLASASNVSAPDEADEESERWSKACCRCC